MEIPKYLNDRRTSDSRNSTDGHSDKNSRNEVRILSVDKVTVEKIVLQTCKTRKVLLTKCESSRIVSEQNNNLCLQSESVGDTKHVFKLNVDSRTNSRINEKKVRVFKNSSKTPVLSIRENSIPSFTKVRIRPIRLTKSSVNASNLKIKRGLRTWNILKHKENHASDFNIKIGVEIPTNKEKREIISNIGLSEKSNIQEEVHDKENKSNVENIESKCDDVAAHNRLENCQYQIEQLQKTLNTKINLHTVKIYKQKLPGFYGNLTKVSPSADRSSNQNTDKPIFDKDFLDKLNLCKKLKIEEKRLLETNLDEPLDSEKDEPLGNVISKRNYSKQVSTLEKKWSENWLKNNLETNSSESSKSSYIEEIESLSSCEFAVKDKYKKETNSTNTNDCELNKISSIRTFMPRNSSSLTDSFFQEKKLKALKALRENLEETGINTEYLDSDKKVSFSTSEIKLNCSVDEFEKDGYANLIRLFTMESCASKPLKEEKKKKGLRRLLPGIFSPKESHKTYRKDGRERKRHDDKHVTQYQQNGNYSLSQDTMKLNEDIRRNVTLDSSLNGSMIEERMHEIKQDLFPIQGIITSTPDHFLRSESNYSQGRHSQRHYPPNPSFDFVSPEEEWIEQNMISGSPDMRKLKNSRLVEPEQHCNLERKHSFQEPVQSCFIRNHSQSGRISAPPSERYLIRSRVVHPVDRPLPAIPQRMYFINENKQELNNSPRGVQQHRLEEIGYRDVRDEFYEQNDGMERLDGHRNQILDSSINQAHGTVQVHQSRPIYPDEKGIHVGRTPKYSPSLSQKSGDYADSTYTPNSSQKSGFSPSSSKSGEYYLNSPHASIHASPSNSSEDRCELVTDPQSSPSTDPYQTSHNLVNQSLGENLYDETPTTAQNENYPTSPRSPVHMMSKNNLNQESSCTQRGSPNIPMSSNLIKLHANVEDTFSKDETVDNKNASNTGFNEQESHSRSLSPDSKISNVDDAQASSPDRIKSVTSPLTIIPPGCPPFCSDSLSPSTDSSQGILKETDQTKPASPSSVREPVKTKGFDQIKSPCMNQSTVVSTPLRKAHPSDQILIASPKRDMIYDSPISHSIMKSELGCPESPIPMVDSPSQVLDSKQSLKHIVAERAVCPRSPVSQQPIIQSNKPPDRKPMDSSCDNREVVQDISPNRQEAPSNIPLNESPKHFQNQEPIYVRRASAQRNVPNALNISEVPHSQNSGRVTPSNNSIYSESRFIGTQPTNLNSQLIYSGKPNGATVNREKIYVSRNSPQQQAINNQIQQQRLQSLADQDAIYVQKIYDSSNRESSSKKLSPSKKQTMHNLENFFWQQKALDAQKKSVSSSKVVKHQPQIHNEAPEVRDAMYWQKLKKLDEEQQRRFYEQNQRDERNDPIYWKKKLQSSPTKKVHRHGSAPSLFHQPSPAQVQAENLYWENKMQRANETVIGKPPIMGQKGQNQPVLVVRPQPVAQERTQKTVVQSSSVEQEVSRCQSASPRFLINEDSRNVPVMNKEKGNASVVRKPETPPIYEEDMDIDRKPQPIFKRGSLISNSSSSIEYGTMGTKRVSFSNHANSPKWPTKHGMAPEPPTRRNKEDEARAPILQQQIDLNNSPRIYGNLGQHSDIYSGGPINMANPSRSLNNNNLKTGNVELEYDANRPLPPPPRDSSWSLKRSASLRETTRTTRIDLIPNKNEATRKCTGFSESESGSEAGEVQRIFHRRPGGSGRTEGEGANDPSNRRGGGGSVFGSAGTRGSGISGSGGGGRSRDEPRRHTLSGDHQPSLHHQPFNSAQQIHPLHPHHLPPVHSQYGTLTGRHTMDLEMGTKSRQRKAPLPRGYPPPSSAMLFDDDPGIMSEVETSSTGFRRGGKQRSSLPVVRTPSKTLERPLGLVFLQYRSETKRALLPNEITSIDTVKALFVRSFPKQLTMEYLDSPHVKVYIHDSSKDMFYELEDLRSHLRDIRDRSVLRLFESSDGMPGPLGGHPGTAGLPPHWEDQSYFSEPEFDSEFQHQHIHKSKNAKNATSGNYYMSGSSTLPRGGPLLRAYSPATSSVGGPNSTPTQSKTLSTPGGGGVAPAKPLRSYQGGKSPLGSLGGSSRFSRDSSVSLYSIPDRIHGEGGYMSSPERGSGVGTGSGRYPPVPYSGASSYEDPYYSQYSGTVTPVIDEEASDTELLEESYSLYGVKPSGRPPSGPLARSPFPPGAPTLPPVGPRDDVTRLRVENMERQLANLTGIVQKALIHPPHPSPSPRDYLQLPAGRETYARSAGAGDEFDKHSSSSSASMPDDSFLRTDVKPPKLGKDKSVSFEKSVSFSDEPPDMNSPKQHSPQHAADTKPTKPAIKSSTLPRMSSQERERERHKPTPPPKPVALATGQYMYGDLALAPEMYNQLRVFQKKAKDLNQEKRNLRRMAQAQAHTVRESIRDSYITIRAMLMSLGESAWTAGDTEKLRLSREEDLYKQEMLWLEKDLTGLESTVEELRGNVINRKTRVNMSDVENMALILNKASKTVADLKVRFPSLQEGMKGLLSSEMEKVMREEKFLKEEPDRLESVLKRCKKLTGTLVTLKRLASVQEQRLPNAGSVDAEETPPVTPTTTQHSKTTTPVPAERTFLGSASVIGGGTYVADSSAPNQQRPENALDALLDELQTFSRPASQLSQASNTSHPPTLADLGRSASHIIQTSRAPNISDIGRKGSIDSTTSTLRRLHSYPSSSDTDTSPPIARLQVSDSTIPPQKPPVPERNAELLQLATARRVPPPPPPRTSSRSPLASPTSPQLPPRNPTGTLRRGKSNGKPPMALPPNATSEEQPLPNNILSTSNSSSCESVNSQEGIQNKKGRHEQLEQRHQELLRRQKVLQEQYTRLQQFQNTPPAPSDLLKKTGSESNLLAKMGLGLSTSTASSGSLSSLASKANQEQNANQQAQNSTGNQTKVYETDIL
ncbi:uncharacterized protein LOC117176829 isoform X2 [Belonocnema kinseyi]|uniref:uncharacterized protein LOC117176829 isoform X2 n=1 Tax=Belonocnema kinseyi TaxID=2817044 RepID=UPI00143DEECE|nr:uncharacterized protein LOC117176829 isoform X2 [Belonocnema kinseyi]